MRKPIDQMTREELVVAVKQEREQKLDAMKAFTKLATCLPGGPASIQKIEAASAIEQPVYPFHPDGPKQTLPRQPSMVEIANALVDELTQQNLTERVRTQIIEGVSDKLLPDLAGAAKLMVHLDHKLSALLDLDDKMIRRAKQHVWSDDPKAYETDTWPGHLHTVVDDSIVRLADDAFNSENWSMAHAEEKIQQLKGAVTFRNELIKKFKHDVMVKNIITGYPVGSNVTGDGPFAREGEVPVKPNDVKTEGGNDGVKP